MGDVSVFGKPLPGVKVVMPYHRAYPGIPTTPKDPKKEDPKKR